MYQAKKRVLPPKKRYKVLRVILVLTTLVALGLLIFWYLRRPQVSVNDNGAILVPINDTESKKHFAEKYYDFDLPSDWKEIDRRNYPYKVVTWKGTEKESAARTIDIYIDLIPANMSLNRILPVSGQDDRLGVNPASENCVLFTDDTAKLTPEQATKLPERSLIWNSIRFTCDIPNSLRNVVGTGSTEGINRVSVTGVKGGKHLYFFVYTDHSAHPDEKTFPDMLRSFRAI